MSIKFWFWFNIVFAVANIACATLAFVLDAGTSSKVLHPIYVAMHLGCAGVMWVLMKESNDTP